MDKGSSMTPGEIVALIVGVTVIGGLLVSILWFLVRLQLAHNDLKKDQEHDNEWLERTSKKTENTNKVVRLVYMNQVRIMDQMKIQPASPEDSNVDLPSI